MIELKTYAGSNVTPQNDAIMNDTNTLNNGIYYGCNVTIKDATTLHINAGQGIVYGRLFEVLDSDIPVSLSPSGTLLGQLYVHIDLSNIAAPIQILVDTGETLADLEDDPHLNIDSGITDMQLATFTVSTVGMSDLVETFKEVEPIRAVLGDADISAIGDGTVKGSIRTINTHLSDKADKVWTIAGNTGTVGGAVTVPALGVSEFLLVGAININGNAEISGSVNIPMQFLVQDRNFRIQLGFASEVGQIQIGYNKSESKFFIANEYYNTGSIYGRAMEVYYR